MRLRSMLAALSVIAGAGCATSSAPPQRGQATSPSSARSSEPSRDRSARTYGWISLSVGAEATVVALVTSGMMLHEKSLRDGSCDAQKVCTPAGLNANASLGQLGGWNAAAWIVAVIGLGAGGYLLWSHPSEGSSRTAIAVDAIGTGVGLGVRSTF